MEPWQGRNVLLHFALAASTDQLSTNWWFGLVVRRLGGGFPFTPTRARKLNREQSGAQLELQWEFLPSPNEAWPIHQRAKRSFPEPRASDVASSEGEARSETMRPRTYKHEHLQLGNEILQREHSGCLSIEFQSSPREGREGCCDGP